jgi:murein DD-endopeptidase MepM/ murein hydrolase activator NlpD
MKKNMLFRLFAAGLLAAAFACTPLNKIADTITNPQPRDLYAREFRNMKTTFETWDNAHNASLENGVEINLPYGEKGVFHSIEPAVYNYNINLSTGEMLSADIVKNNPRQRIFMEIYAWDESKWNKVLNAAADETHIEYPVMTAGRYKFVLQPEIGAKGNFFLAINKKPVYHFPVAGKSNSAIGSFWADPRDGGRRSHEGIDIFAKRGTPVLAATEGSIGFAGERGIGGKQVWLRTGLFGNSVYYAHLDRIAVSDGMRVHTGDTLGFVGNTGNAKTTVPHLHFGIYGFSGAVNPLPFVRQTSAILAKSFPQHFSVLQLKTKMKARMRSGPAGSYAILQELQPNESVALLGQHKDWLHVKTGSGKTGFVSRKLLRGA